MKSDYNIDPRVKTAFYGRHKSLRDIQAKAEKPLLMGHNVVLSSGTGSGKTEAVVAPIISRLRQVGIHDNSISVLYIAPTKALVNDLEKRLSLSLEYLGLRVGIRHGDRDDLQRKCKPQFLITTPESLDVMLFRKDESLKSIKSVIIDEVHLLYNTQRGLHLSILLKRLQQFTGTIIQWAALSATIGELDDVRRFIFGEESNAVSIQLQATRIIDGCILHIKNEEELKQHIQRLMNSTPTKILMFVNSRHECEKLADVCKGIDSLRDCVFPHYSSLSSDVRQDIEQAYGKARTAICIATSTLELGIDIGDIDAVMLWGVPGNLESFLQRIGRGNRRSQKCNVICLIPHTSDTPLRDGFLFATLLESAQSGILPTKKPFRLYGSVVQQCLNVIASESGKYTRIADLCNMTSHHVHLVRSTVEVILSELAAKGYLQHHGFKNRYGADEKIHKLVDCRLIYGNFPLSTREVEIYSGAKHLGSVPATNLLRVYQGAVVRFKASTWRVQKVSQDHIVLKQASPDPNAIDFQYGGSGYTLDPYICNQLWKYLVTNEITGAAFIKSLREIMNTIHYTFKQHLTEGHMPFTREDDGIQYLTFAGKMINRAIGLITGKHGFIAGDFMLKVSSPVAWSSLPNNPCDYKPIFNRLFEEDNDQSIYQKLLPDQLQADEMLEQWHKDSSIGEILNRLTHSSPKQIERHVVSMFLS